MKVKARPCSNDATAFTANGVKEAEITTSYVCLVYNSKSEVSEQHIQNCDETEKRRNFLVTYEGEYEVNVTE